MTRKQGVITGATSGIGRETAIGLAKKGFDLLIFARNRQKVITLIDELESLAPKGTFSHIDCDLSSIKSVDAAAHVALNRLTHIDVLINNAGGIFQSRQESVDGNELTLAVNHLGPFHLTNRLISLLESSENGRIVNVSSAAHSQAKIDWNDFQLKENWSAIRSYANAKIFNIYTGKYWAKKLKPLKISAYSLHPGVVRTGFAGNFRGPLKFLLSLMHPFMISARKGAETSIYLATAEQIEGYSGAYFSKSRVAQPSKQAHDEEAIEKLIDKSNLLIKRVLSNRG